MAAGRDGNFVPPRGVCRGMDEQAADRPHTGWAGPAEGDGRHDAADPTDPTDPSGRAGAGGAGRGDDGDPPGHLAELRALYAACYRRLVARVFALTGDLAAAEDAAAEAFARAALAPRAFRRADDREAWLRDTALARALRRSRRAALAARLAPWRGRAAEPDGGAWDGDGLPGGQHAVLDGLRRLPDREREAVTLHHLAGLTVHEVATLLGVADGTVRSRLDRGERRLSGVDGAAGAAGAAGADGTDGASNTDGVR